MITGRDKFDALLEQAKRIHDAHPKVSGFCPFPDDIVAQDVTPFHIPPSDLMQNDRALFTSGFEALRDAFVAASPYAQWRETYKGTQIAQDFMDRFGCYCLIGEGGPYVSEKMRAWVVYMPAGLHYPWHHHPAEEMYLTLAGEAVFCRLGVPEETLRSGDVSEHTSNQPHAMTTFAHPVMAYVIWRNGFETGPVLTQD